MPSTEVLQPEDDEKRPENGSKKDIGCDVCIVGGGISGLYVAEALLREQKEQRICIVESEGILGGRICDHKFQTMPNVSVALGAYRVGVKHGHVMGLLKRLNIPYEEWDHQLPLMCVARGMVFDDMDDLMSKVFPALKERNLTTKEMYQYILDPSRKQTAKDFASIQEYISHHLGDEEAEFLLSRFSVPGDMEGFVNTRDCLNYMDACLKEGSKYVRPMEGMSALVRGLTKAYEQLGGEIVLNSPVHTISRRNGGYVITGENLVINSTKLVIAVPPSPFKHIKGGVATEIQDHQTFQSIGYLNAVKAAAVYSEQWWLQELNNGLSLQPLQMLVSKNTLGKVIPYRGTGPNGEGILQTVYMEGGLWGDRKEMNTDNIQEYIHCSLEKLFPDVNIPKPLETVYKYWSHGAVHTVRQGSQVTVPELMQWTKRPLPGEDVFLVGEAYGPGLGWTESALISASKVLEEGWQINDPHAFKR